MDVTIAVGRGTKTEREVAITEANTTTRWSLSVQGGFDIGYEVLFIAAGGKGGGIARPAARVKHDVGSYVSGPGRLLFTLDNAFSMLRSKSVELSVIFSKEVPFTDAEIADSQLMNDRFMVGIELFFTNRFADAERYFATEKERVGLVAQQQRVDE